MWRITQGFLLPIGPPSLDSPLRGISHVSYVSAKIMSRDFCGESFYGVRHGIFAMCCCAQRGQPIEAAPANGCIPAVLDPWGDDFPHGFSDRAPLRFKKIRVDIRPCVCDIGYGSPDLAFPSFEPAAPRPMSTNP